MKPGRVLRSGAATGSTRARPLNAATPRSRVPAVAPEAPTWLPGRTRAEVAALDHALGTHQAFDAPIPVWKRGDKRFVIDDIDRFEHCLRDGIEPTYVEFEFESEDQARLFVLERNQARQFSSVLGRRYIDGAIYNLSRRPGARTDLTSHRTEGKLATAKLMQRFGRSRPSLERDGKLARQIDETAACRGPTCAPCFSTRSMDLGPLTLSALPH